MTAVAAVVLLVDDDAELRVACADAVRCAGHEVLEASTLSQARESINARKPDVIVLDVRLWDGDGIAAAAAWRKCASLNATPIVILTGESSRSSIEAALLAGCDAFLAKPCTTEDLIAQVERVLASRRRLAKLA
jgi:DNA-binding response OmpR family regulator